MITLSLRDLVRNAAVFSQSYGAATRRAERAGCSRQTLYEQARRVERLLEPAAPDEPPAEVATPTPSVALDEPTRRRRAVTALAMGLSTRPIEDLIRVILPEGGPDHATIGRRVAEGAKEATAVLETLDAAGVPEVRSLAIDAIVFGGDRPRSASSRPA